MNDTADRTTGARRPPLHHGARSGGVCRWCGLEVLHTDGPGAGRPDRRRAWHPDCVLTYKLHAWPKLQWAYVRRRDGGRCHRCGERPKKWRAARRESVDRLTRARYVRVKRGSALELDHTVPLWSVAHLPAEARRSFYGPDNLRLLCPACHLNKTREEAAERASRKGRRPPMA